MRFFLDENFPLSAVSFLQGQGHEAIRALDIFPQGTADSALYLHAQKEKAIFLTTDRDFFHTVPFLYEERTAPVVAITLNQPNGSRILARLEAVMQSADILNNPLAVFLVTDTRILKRI